MYYTLKSLYILLIVCCFLNNKASALATIDLTQENQPLENFRTQDQNGIGSCYANSAATVLQGILPENPEVSYFDLALRYKESKGMYGSLSEVLNGGFICQTILEAKKSGGACPRSDVLFESFTIHGDKKKVTQQLLSGVDKVYSAMDRLTPEQNNYFINQLEDYYQKKVENSLEQCKQLEENRTSNMSIYKSLAVVAHKLNREYKILKNKKNKNNEQKLQLKSLKLARKNIRNKLIYDPPLRILRDRREVKKNKLIQDLIKEKYLPMVKDFDLSKTDDLPVFEKMFYGHLGLGNFPKLYKGSINLNRVTWDKEMSDPKTCANMEAINILSNYNNIYQDNKDTINTCNLHYQVNMASGLFSLIKDELPLFVDNELFDSLRNYQNKDDFLRSIFKANCDDNKIQIPTNLNCTTFDPHYKYHRQNLKKESIITSMRNRIHNQLTNKIPVGIGVCSTFLTKKGHDSDFGSDDKCNDSGLNRFHALTIVGYKELTYGTGETKIKYLIQNSWGENCGYQPISDNCIGETGRFWINETELLTNVRGLNEITL